METHHNASLARVVGRFVHKPRIAYFSMEVALRPEIHTYGGGLGVLAGDTARSAADLELPMVVVTLISRAGYLRQEFDDKGRQVDRPDPWEPEKWATPLGAKISVQIENREVWLRPWLYVLEGAWGYEVPVLLLDTDLEENLPEDRRIADRLYGAGRDYRLRQEIVLGIGGVRILRALGFVIHTYHMNEGHSALLALELLRWNVPTQGELRSDELGIGVARVRELCVFTTHTPVEAGHDRFSYDMVERLLDSLIDITDLKTLTGPDDLNMTRLALNLSNYVNGVAKRHAEVSANLFPGYTVKSITNGVHLETWTHPSFARLYQANFPEWHQEPEVLVRADQLRDEEVWGAHQEAKRDLIGTVRDLTGVEMDPEVPIIGFARRMTGYKRADLLFTDVDRLMNIHQRFPFQIVMAGKAHPEDAQGKDLIQFVNSEMRRLRNVARMVFLPNYDMTLGRVVTSGSDVWLNTPLPPREASGTSGMKAALNGGLNLSVLDGWWIEACIEGCTGWAVGDHSGSPSSEADAESLYEKLEQVVLPLYYNDRGRWIWMMKEAISKIPYYFNSHRMMLRYAAEAYIR